MAIGTGYTSALYRWHFTEPDVVLLMKTNYPELVTLSSLSASTGLTVEAIKALLESYSATVGEDVPIGKSLALQWFTAESTTGIAIGVHEVCTLADTWRVFTDSF